MKPTIGRIVHYHPRQYYSGEYVPAPLAAIVTVVHDIPEPVVVETPTEHHTYISTVESVSLAVFDPRNIGFEGAVPYAEVPTPGHWSWPPREEVISTPTLTGRSPADC